MSKSKHRDSNNRQNSCRYFFWQSTNRDIFWQSDFLSAIPSPGVMPSPRFEIYPLLETFAVFGAVAAAAARCGQTGKTKRSVWMLDTGFVQQLLVRLHPVVFSSVLRGFSSLTVPDFDFSHRLDPFSGKGKELQLTS